MQKQVFISYSSNDLPTAEKICSLLESNDIRCWIAPRDVMPGSNYAEEIITAIENSEAFILLCSRHTNDSVHVRSEVEHAFSRKKRMFPVRIDDAELGRAYEYFLGSSQWLEVRDKPLEECAVRLAQSILKPTTDRIESHDAPPREQKETADNRLSDRTAAINPNNLPAIATRLVGREREVAEVVALLGREDVRLVTLTGPGGTGKTRLSIAAAETLLNVFQSGVFFVGLAPISDPHLVVTTINQTLGIPMSGTNTGLESLKNYLRGKSVLIILDNFEQVITAAADISELLQECPECKVLVTSREVLRLNAEHSYSVPPLSNPDTTVAIAAEGGIEEALRFEAVAFFNDRANSANPKFEITSENVSAIVEICRRLDGLPLAIELAVARMSSHAPQEILARLGEILPFLTKGPRNLPARQQTLRATIGWSYELLTRDEQSMLNRLTAFTGGFDLDAVEAICGSADGSLPALSETTYDLVESLQEKSLITKKSISGTSRFSFLETIREYAAEKLAVSGEEAIVRQRHADYYLSVATKAQNRFFTKDMVFWLDVIEKELDNVRSALSWFRKHDVNSKFRFASSLWVFWHTRGLAAEGLSWLEDVLECESEVSPETYTKALSIASFLHIVHSDLDKAERCAAKALSCARENGDLPEAAFSSHVFSFVPYFRGEYVVAEESYNKCLEYSKAVNDEWLIANSIRMIALCSGLSGNNSKSEELFAQCIDLSERRDDTFTISYALFNAAAVALSRDDHKRAQMLCGRSLSLSKDLGDKFGMVRALEKMSVAIALGGGQAPSVAVLFGAIEGVRSDIGWQLPSAEASDYSRSIVAAKKEIGEDSTFMELSEKGRRMSLSQAVDYALEMAVEGDGR